MCGVYVSICACIHARVCVRVCVIYNLCMPTCCAYVGIGVCKFTSECVCVSVCVCVCVCVCMCVSVCVCVCVWIGASLSGGVYRVDIAD